MASPQQSQSFSCPSCSTQFSLSDLSTIRKHLRARHESDPYFRVLCPYCQKPFTTVRYWFEHVARHNIPGQDCADRCHETQLYDDTEAGPASSEECSKGKESDYDFEEALSALVVRLRASNYTETSCRDVLEFVGDYTKNAVKEAQRVDSKGSKDDVGSKGDAPLEPVQGTAVQECEKLLSSKCLERTALKRFDIQESCTISLDGENQNKNYTYEYLPFAPQIQEFFKGKNVNDVLKTQLLET